MEVHCRLNPLDKASARGKPVPFVHVDYTTKSGYERLEALVPEEEAERLRKTPFAAIQVSGITAVHIGLEDRPHDKTVCKSSVYTKCRRSRTGVLQQRLALDPQLLRYTPWGP